MKKICSLSLVAALSGYLVGCAEETSNPAPSTAAPATHAAPATTGGHASPGATGGHASPGAPATPPAGDATTPPAGDATPATPPAGDAAPAAETK
jgi:hypothetical protein